MFFLDNSVEGEEKYVQLCNEYYNDFIETYRNKIDEDFMEEDIISEAGGRVAAAKGVVTKAKRMDKKISGKVDATFDRIVKDARKAIIGQSREEIINNRMKVSTLVKKAIVLGVPWAISPILGLLTTFIHLVTRSRLKIREKNRILADLKGELEMCEEKIRDAEAENDKQKKYQLMRLRRELQRSIEKIRFAPLIKE